MGNSHSCMMDSADGRSLLVAAEAGNSPQVGLVLFQDINYLRYRSSFGRNTAWHKASKAGKLPVLTSMANMVAHQFEATKDIYEGPQGLKHWGATPKEVMEKLVNASNGRGYTPLMLACRGGHVEVVKFLLAHGADAFKRDRMRRQSCLHFAAEAGQAECIGAVVAAVGHAVNRHKKRLVEVGNHAGLTPLHYAVYCDQTECMKVLIAADANINAQGDFADLDWQGVNAGDTPMHVAASKGNIEAIRILLKAFQEMGGVMLPSVHDAPAVRRERRYRDPRMFRNDYGRLPYHVAVRKGHVYLTEMLDPSVPVRYLLSGEELDTSGASGPPRLAVLAAAALHTKLLQDLESIKAKLAHKAADAAAGDGDKQRLGGDGEAVGGQEGDDGTAVKQRRTWSWGSRRNSLQRSTSLHEIGVRLRLSLGPHREGSSDDDAAAAEGQGAQAPPVTPPGARTPVRHPATDGRLAGGNLSLLRVSEEFSAVAVAVAADDDSRSYPPVTPPSAAPATAAAAATQSCTSPRELLHLADGAVSVLLRALPSRRLSMQHDPHTGDPTATSSTATGATSDGTLTTPTGRGRSMRPSWGQLTPPKSTSGGLWSAFASYSQQQQPQGCSTDEASTSAAAAAAAGADGHGAPNARAMPRCFSTPEASGSGTGGGCEASTSAGAAAEKVSPNPELLIEGTEPPSGLLGAVLKPFRRSHRVLPVLSAMSRAASDFDDALTCGVCLDCFPNTFIQPCKHQMCAECASDMCKRYSMASAVCPYCRAVVAGFTLAPQH